MKNILFFAILVVLMSLAITVSAEDLHYTCESDPSVLTSGTFDNLFLNLKGCGAEIELSDVTVTGNLIYDGGNDQTDHSIKISNSKIHHILFPCENSHQCKLSIDYRCEVEELTAMPSGKEKGKIFLYGNFSENTIRVSYINRLNMITNEMTDDIRDSLKMPAVLPTDYSIGYVPAGGDAEIELKDINIVELSVVNENNNVTPSFSMRDYVRIYLAAVYSPRLKLYRTEYSKDTYANVFSLFTSVDGTNFELSVDGVYLNNFHFLGNNNQNSLLTLKNGYEKVHGSDYIMNVFIFGGNMNFMGYTTPKRGTPTLRRLIYTVQPEAYVLDPSPSILNNLMKNYAEIAESASEDGRQFMFPFSTPIHLEKFMLGLTQQFVKNYPDINLGWSPYVKLSYVNIMYANVADSIRDKVPQMNMFLIQNDSFMTGSRDVTRYGLKDSLNFYHNDLIQINEFSALWDQLGEGCYTFGFDQYGNLVVK